VIVGDAATGKWKEITANLPRTLSRYSFLRRVAFDARSNTFWACGNDNKVWFSADGERWTPRPPRG